MALSNTTADALAEAFIDSIAGLTPAQIADAKTKWKSFARLLYSHLKTDIEIKIVALSITTTGSASTQTGPQAPGLTLNPQ